METITEFNKLGLWFIPLIIFGFLGIRIGRYLLNRIKRPAPRFREHDRFEKEDNKVPKITTMEIFGGIFRVAVLLLCFGGLYYSGVQLAPLFRSKVSSDF